MKVAKTSGLGLSVVLRVSVPLTYWCSLSFVLTKLLDDMKYM